MKIQEVVLDELNPAEYNPRRITRAELKSLVRSMKEFGVVEPIVANKDNTVIGGHQRLKAAYELNLKTIPVIYVDLPKAKEKLLNLALNRISGKWDESKLAHLLAELETDLTSEEVQISGFAEIEIDKLVDEYGLNGKTSEEDNFDPEAEARKIKKPESKRGEIYLLGKHRLMCGDSTKKEDVEKLMAGKKADMVFTDPPYNVNYGSSKNPRHKIPNLVSDNQTADQWHEFCEEIALRVKENCLGDVYCWTASGPEGMKLRLALIEAGCHWSATIAWVKQQLVLSPANYQRKYEPCFYGWFERSSFCGGRKQTEVWEIDRPHNSKSHPTMKPISLCSKGIKNSSQPGEIVLDLFGDSGSTLIACEQSNRICYMMEIDPLYCDVIRKRYASYVQKKN
jgi:DNA modification methylase/nitrogen fixation protein